MQIKAESGHRTTCSSLPVMMMISRNKIETKLGANQLIFDTVSLLVFQPVFSSSSSSLLSLLSLPRKQITFPHQLYRHPHALTSFLLRYSRSSHVIIVVSDYLPASRQLNKSPKTGIFKSSYFTFHFKCASLARDAIYMLILPFPSPPHHTTHSTHYLLRLSCQLLCTRMQCVYLFW